jgi:hypothetical protein
MIRELDTVALTHNLDVFNLKEGDIGAVVHCYEDGKAFEVEFVNAGGDTIAVTTLRPEEIRPIRDEEILHVRIVAPKAA